MSESEWSGSNSRQERLWQFRIEEKTAESMMESSSFFLHEAQTQAAKFDHRVVSIRDVCLTYSRGRVLLVVGTAELMPR
jgi:hypothetical protein